MRLFVSLGFGPALEVGVLIRDGGLNGITCEARRAVNTGLLLLVPMP